jgi:hypothetical protein
MALTVKNDLNGIRHFRIRNADICQDTDRQDHHTRGRVERHDRERQGENPRQGGHPTRPAAAHFRGQATRRRSDVDRLQHPKGVYLALGASTALTRTRPVGDNSRPAKPINRVLALIKMKQ